MAVRKSIQVLAASAVPVLIAFAAADAAPSAEVAKKCRELMVKAYPPPLAGTKKGNAQEEREFFRVCVAKNGNMDEGGPPRKKD